MRRQPTFTRADRLEHLMLDEVDRLLNYEIRSPLARLCKVVHVKLSGDLGHLRVSYVLHAGGEPGKEIQEVLDSASTYVGRTLVESLQLRKRPTVVFSFDRDAMHALRVQDILRAEQQRTAASDPTPPPAGDPDPER